MAEAETNGSMKNLVAYIAQNLVDNPNSVSVDEVSSGQTMVLELHVAKPDIGKVIGRQGRTAHAHAHNHQCRFSERKETDCSGNRRIGSIPQPTESRPSIPKPKRILRLTNSPGRGVPSAPKTTAS